jgi:hypothetical protein
MVVIIVAILAACTPGMRSPRVAPAPSVAPTVEPETGALAVTPDGSIWLVRAGSQTLEKWLPSGESAALTGVPVPVPLRVLRPANGDGVLASGNDWATLVAASGTAARFEGALDVARDERLSARGSEVSIVAGSRSRTTRLPGSPLAGRLASPGSAVVLVRGAEGEWLYRVDPDGAKPIAGPFQEIDSFDLPPDGEEVVFSAKRDSNFDVGLVAVSGSEIRWIGPDPLDERIVKWAPRGNKVAYVLHTPAGAVVRSVHITTGFQVSAPLPLTTVRDVAWDPAAEKLALLVTSSEAGERVDLMRFDGSDRRTAIPPLARTDAPDQLGGVVGAVVFAPERLRYNERVPLVVWESGEGAFAFHEGRARLQQNRRVGSVVVSPGAASNPAFWAAIGELGWVDPAAVFIVTGRPFADEALPAGFRATLLAKADHPQATQPRVTVVRSDTGSLEDFAVTWLGERLRGFER